MVRGAEPKGPLTGVRVLDFSSFIAGCYGAQLLGDLGATVTKVEPLGGDGARHWGPFLAGESRFFQGWNRNKRSIALDLRQEAGLRIVHALTKRSDVVLENFRPGITEKLGIDYESLKRHRPDLIYCSITAFGTRGPCGTRPGYDPILQSMSGAARGNVRYSGHVGICSVAVSDYGAAMLASNCIVAALYHRERTGDGQKIDTSLLHAVMAVQSHMFCEGLDIEETPPFGIFPYKQFETKDDLIFIAAATDRFWQKLCTALERPELGTDPRYATNADRVNQKEALTEILSAIFRQRTTEEWEQYLVDEGVPCSGMRNYDEFFADPQVAALGMDPVLDHPTIGRLRVAGVPFEFEKTPGSIRNPAPLLGEHTSEILEGLGYSAAAIAELERDGAVKVGRRET